MADFDKAFEAIDVDGSGEITVGELEAYMLKNNYKENFVAKWLKLFDNDGCGVITYKHYCDTLGLTPKERVPTDSKVLSTKNNEETVTMTVAKKESSKAAADVTSEKKKKRTPQSYPIQAKKKATKNRTKLFSQHKRRLRASIQPGVILILLAGRHRGKRVVFLKQLSSGLLLVSGPFKLNGCPLRRVHQKLVIATKTKIDISAVQVPEHINDVYFSRASEIKQSNADVSNIFAKTKKEYILKEDRKTDQKTVDKQLLVSIKAREDKITMTMYLKSLFSLSSHDCPHKMQF